MSLQEKLRNHDSRRELLGHPFFIDVETQKMTRDDVAIFIGQWWHPLAYFPRFLSRLIATTPTFEMQTAISQILHEELGEGIPSRAHPLIYIETMTAVGFPREVIDAAPALPATERLIDGYTTAPDNVLTGLGFLYGTETADLAMVSGLGTAVRSATGVQDLPWVDIHVQQEPGHVDRANEALEPEFSPQQEAEIIVGAENMWWLWIDFFSALRKRISQPTELSSSC